MPSHPLSAYDLDCHDPRLDEAYVRRILPAGDEGEVVLVGVVHDHPASVFRAATVAAAVDPAVVGLELPPIAVPAFETYARSGSVPPARGGEFSAAIRATPGARHVGIDGPSGAFFRALASAIREQRPSLGAIRRVARSVVAIGTNAVEHRLTAALGRYTSFEVTVDAPTAHPCTHDDPVRRQAADEAKQVHGSYSLLRAAIPPEPIQLRDSSREAGMTSRLRALRREGTVVAIVGLDHLDPVADALADAVADSSA